MTVGPPGKAEHVMLTLVAEDRSSSYDYGRKETNPQGRPSNCEVHEKQCFVELLLLAIYSKPSSFADI